MPTLDVAAAGPVDARWLARIAALPAWVVPERAHVVVVSPHPDDETLGLGGTLQRLVARGARVDLLAVTDGDASHPGVPGLGARRRRELGDALGRLGVAAATRVHHLAVADGDVAGHTGTLERAVRRVATPDSLVLAPRPDDGHADHDAAGRAATLVAHDVGATAWSYPVWAWHWHDPDDGSLLTGAHRVPLAPRELGRKRDALDAYTSQLTDELGPPVVPAHVLARLLRDHEVLVPCA